MPGPPWMWDGDELKRDRLLAKVSSMLFSDGLTIFVRKCVFCVWKSFFFKAFLIFSAMFFSKNVDSYVWRFVEKNYMILMNIYNIFFMRVDNGQKWRFEIISSEHE